jgi:hypothetical protein
MALAKLSRCARERVVESDHVQLTTQLVDRSDRGPQRARVDASTALSGGRGSACFGVDQLAGGDGLCTVPQLGGDV